jgi:hypothetical protein
MSADVPTVDFWFDPVCPYSWIGSRWIPEVERQRPVRLRWHVMSLYLLNRGRNPDVSYVAYLEQVHGTARVATAVAVRHGSEALRDVYTAYGTQIFDHWRYAEADECRAAMGAALREVTLPAGLVDAFDTPAYDDALARSHAAAIAPVGDEAGTPTIHLGDTAFYGPILNSIPRGEDALRVFDGARMLCGFDDFYELKRTRERPPVYA